MGFVSFERRVSVSRACASKSLSIGSEEVMVWDANADADGNDDANANAKPSAHGTKNGEVSAATSSDLTLRLGQCLGLNKRWLLPAR